MNLTQERLVALEDILMQELRVCQAIQYLIEEERRVMTAGNVDGLSAVIEQKKDYLDEINLLEEACRKTIQELAQLLDVPTPSASLADLFPALTPDLAARLNRLRTSILGLLKNIRDLTYGNRALADSALKRVDAIQAFILNLVQPSANYSAPGLHAQPEATISWDVDQRA